MRACSSTDCLCVWRCGTLYAFFFYVSFLRPCRSCLCSLRLFHSFLWKAAAPISASPPLSSHFPCLYPSLSLCRSPCLKLSPHLFLRSVCALSVYVSLLCCYLGCRCFTGISVYSFLLASYFSCVCFAFLCTRWLVPLFFSRSFHAHPVVSCWLRSPFSRLLFLFLLSVCIVASSPMAFLCVCAREM